MLVRILEVRKVEAASAGIKRLRLEVSVNTKFSSIHHGAPRPAQGPLCLETRHRTPCSKLAVTHPSVSAKIIYEKRNKLKPF